MPMRRAFRTEGKIGLVQWMQNMALLARSVPAAAPEQGQDATTAAEPAWEVEPFVHVEADHLYNPLEDKRLRCGEPFYEEVRALATKRSSPAELPRELRRSLAERGWLVELAPSLANRYRLQMVSLETTTVCNQACSFCPVSTDPRPPHVMSLEFYEHIARQLAEFRSTLLAVFLHNYNEPTTDRWFLDRVRILKRHGLPPACNTNATGLTPARVDALIEMGGLCYLSVNLSTLDRQRYRQERGVDHLDQVLRNLDVAGSRPVAEQMDLAVLGCGDKTHRKNFEEIRQRFSGSRFNVKLFLIYDRAGSVSFGLGPSRPHERLRGCENLGSRPLQHLHVTATGTCVLCCQDYHEQHVVGDLNRQTVAEVLAGPEMAKMRRWAYGLEEAPDDFLCRRCSFARTDSTLARRG